MRRPRSAARRAAVTRASASATGSPAAPTACVGSKSSASATRMTRARRCDGREAMIRTSSDEANRRRGLGRVGNPPRGQRTPGNRRQARPLRHLRPARCAVPSAGSSPLTHTRAVREHRDEFGAVARASRRRAGGAERRRLGAGRTCRPGARPPRGRPRTAAARTIIELLVRRVDVRAGGRERLEPGADRSARR